MRRTWAIVKREYLTRVKTIRFVAGTVLTPLFMVIWIAAPNYFASKSKGQRDVIMLDQTGSLTLFNAIQTQLKNENHDASSPSGQKNLSEFFEIGRKEVAAGANLETIRNEEESVPPGRRERVLLLLPAQVLDGAPPVYVGTTLSDPAISDFERLIRNSILQTKLVRAGIQPDTLQQITNSAPMKREHMSSVGRVSGEDAESVAIVMLVTMYTVIFLYGVWMMRGVSTEKKSRIAEVLLTIAKPVELMSGKLLGIGMVGLTQCLIWVVVAAIVSLPGLAIWKALGFQFPHISVAILCYFVVYFLMGYFLYATLFALAGASTTSTDDANYIQQPLILLTVTPMLVFFLVLRDPSGTTSVVLSLVPFFSPTLMLLRLAISNPPLWQVALSFALMGGSILFAVWLTAKVYRAGILMSGKRQTFVELVRWLRYA